MKTAEEFDTYFDEGGSVVPFADLEQASRPNKVKQVNVDFPLWMIEALDKKARHIGVSREALLKFWIADRLEENRV